MTPPIEQHSLAALEFPALATLLASFAYTEPGRERACSVRPSTDAGQVAEWLDETSEMTRLLAAGSLPALASIGPLGPVIAQLDSPAAPLEPPELLDIAALLETGTAVRMFFEAKRDDAPRMWRHAERLAPCPALFDAIRRCIEPDKTVGDAASPLLRDLRRRIAQLRNQIADRLRRLFDDPALLHAFENRNISSRNGRPVVSVKAGARTVVAGSLLDKSNTGATLFVEPHAVTTLANELEDARLDEAREVTRILWELTRLASAEHHALALNLDILATTDLTCAKARFSAEFRMTPPCLSAQPVIELHAARHPLLLHFALQRDAAAAFSRVVPMTIRLGGDFDCLVVTGPNTGGKTVALKTAGLITLMAQAGMHIPADHGSSLHVFSNVFADIGDEQSIEQSLSTFSSHMTTIGRILAASGPQTLVLLDELGSGTDPAEGAALATAILDFLRLRHARVIATTHLGALKLYAYSTPRTENASMQFDLESLMPTFRLIIGQPGSSNALAIARRLNLPGDVIDSAAQLLSQGATGAADLITKVQQSRVEAEEARARAHDLQSALQRRVDEVSREGQRARDHAQHLIEYTIGDMAKVVDEFADAARNAPSPWADKAAELRARVHDIAAGTPLAELRERFVQSVRPGETVYVTSLQSFGEVHEIRKRQKLMRILVDGVVCDVPFSHIAEKPFAQADTRATARTTRPRPSPAPQPEPENEPPQPHTPEALRLFLDSLKPGDRVFVPALKSVGSLISLNRSKDECIIRIGTLDFTLPLAKLRPPARKRHAPHQPPPPQPS